MAYIHIMTYSGLKPMPNVSVHPDGYMVDEHGDVIKQAICPIPGDMSNRLFDGLIPGMVYSLDCFFIVSELEKPLHRNY